MGNSARTVPDVRGGWDTVLGQGVSLSERKSARLPPAGRLAVSGIGAIATSSGAGA